MQDIITGPRFWSDWEPEGPVPGRTSTVPRDREIPGDPRAYIRDFKDLPRREYEYA